MSPIAFGDTVCTTRTYLWANSKPEVPSLACSQLMMMITLCVMKEDKPSKIGILCIAFMTLHNHDSVKIKVPVRLTNIASGCVHQQSFTGKDMWPINFALAVFCTREH